MTKFGGMARSFGCVLLILFAGKALAEVPEQSSLGGPLSAAHIARDLSELGPILTGDVVWFDTGGDRLNLQMMYGDNTSALHFVETTGDGTPAVELIGDYFGVWESPSVPFYEVDIAAENLVFRNVRDGSRVGTWTPSPEVADYIGNIKEPLERLYGTTVIRMPCRSCIGGAPERQYRIAPTAEYMRRQYEIGTVSAVIYSDYWGKVVGPISSRDMEYVANAEAESRAMILKIVQELETKSVGLTIWIHRDLQGEPNIRPKCYTSTCLTSLQVVVPKEVVLYAEVEPKWATFDITIRFGTTSGSGAYFGLDGVAELGIVVDGYAYLRRGGSTRAPEPSSRFTCPPFAEEKRIQETAIAEKIRQWIGD